MLKQWFEKRAARRLPPPVANPIFEKAIKGFGGVILNTISENEVIVESGVALLRLTYHSGTVSVKATGIRKDDWRTGCTGIWNASLGWHFTSSRVSESEAKARRALLEYDGGYTK